MNTYIVTPVSAKGSAIDLTSPFGKLFQSGCLLYMWEEQTNDYVGISVVKTTEPVNPQKGDTIIKNGVAFIVVKNTTHNSGELPQVFVKRVENQKVVKPKKQIIHVTMGKCGNIHEDMPTHEQLLKEKRVMFLSQKICGTAAGIGQVQTKKPVNPKLGDIIVLNDKKYEVEDIDDSFEIPNLYVKEAFWFDFSNMKTKPQTPKIGVAVIIRNKQGQVLMGLRKGSHGEGLWSVPGGHMEIGESFLDVCKREVREEVGLKITDIKQITFTNCIFKKEGLHYVTLFFHGFWNQTDKPEIKEPEKMERLAWVYPVNIRNRKIMPGLRAALNVIFPELKKLK